MKLKQFRPSGLTVKISTALSGRGGYSLYTKDPNWDDFMGELLLTTIKRLADEKDEYLLEFFVEYFEINNFDDILNIDIVEIFNKIGKPYIYDDDDYVGCIGWETGSNAKDLFDNFCEDGEFNEQYLKYSVDESYAGVSIGHLNIIE